MFDILDFEDNEFREAQIINPQNKEEYFDYYKIVEGDNLYNIAKKNNVNLDLLASLNGLDLKDYIYPNQILLIPKSGYNYYITKDGDTLNGVINLFKTNSNKFLNENKIIYLLSGQLLVNKIK
jgi:LysM repeat protein